MHDDDVARVALSALADEPVPAARTTVEQVLARGKRRMRWQRIGAVSTAAAVVAGIAAGTLLLQRSASGAGVQVGAPPSLLTRTAPASRALDGYATVTIDMPVMTTTYTEAPPTAPTFTNSVPVQPGPEANAPTPDTAPACGTADGPPVPRITLLPEDKVVATFVAGLQRVTGDRWPMATSGAWNSRVDRTGGVEGTVSTELRGGIVELRASAHGGTAVAAADHDAFDVGVCTPPRRKTAWDGTVLQLYPRVGRQQELRIYKPSGRMYELQVSGTAPAPLDEQGLAELADVVATLG